MKLKVIARWITILTAVVLCFGILGPLVGFHYPHVIQDEPLHSPVGVRAIEGSVIHLEDGRSFSLEGFRPGGLSNQLTQSGFQIDLEAKGKDTYFVFARQDGWICGTPWAQPIRIPLFRDTVYRNRRELIAVAEPVNSQPSSRANSHQASR